MASGTRTSLWVAGTSVAGGIIIWAFSFAGFGFASAMLARPLPVWLSPIDRGPLLAWEAVALLVAFLLALLCLRRFGAPPQLWLGALAASLLLAGRQFADLAVFARIGADFAYRDVLYAHPFLDPFVALLALAGLPLAVGLACLLAPRGRSAEGAAEVPGPSHA
jgi:hypothetical protein